MGLRLFLALSLAARAAEPSVGRLVTQTLDPDATYRVGIAPHLPTTIVFPSPGLGFQGVGLMQARDTAPQPVQIEHATGTNYFTVRAIMPDARSDLNVIFEGRIYAFAFTLSPDPVRGLTLVRAPTPGRPARSSLPPRLTVDRLVGMLDEAKAYDVIAGAYPGYQRNITSQEKSYRIGYPGFDVIVERVWQFAEEDTVVVRAVFVNRTATPLRYRPDAVALKVGERTFYCSIADASGDIPAAPDAAALAREESALCARPADEARGRLAEIQRAYQRGQAVGYFAVSGNPDGTRANLSVRNNFNVLVATER